MIANSNRNGSDSIRKSKAALIKPALLIKALIRNTPKKTTMLMNSVLDTAIWSRILGFAVVRMIARTSGTTAKCKKLIAEGAPTAFKMRGKKAVQNATYIKIELSTYSFLGGGVIC